MSNWQEAYQRLKEFIARTPQIEIDKSFFVIPADVRPEFNRLFDAVATAFIEAKYPTPLSDAVALSKNFLSAAQEVSTALGLSEIKLPVNLKSLVNDPMSGLTRYLLDPLYGLLKGNQDIDGFELAASEAVVESFKKVFHLGYGKWGLLSLISLLKPSTPLAVPSYPIETHTHELEPDEKRGIYKVEVPAPKETQKMSFDRPSQEPFILPDIIFNSARLARYVSARTDLTDASYSSKDVSPEREWLQLRPVGLLYRPTFFSWPDIVVYADDQPEDIDLVADFSRFCRPDVIMECREREGWFQTEGLEKIRREYDFFKPKMGTFIISRLPVPDEAMQELKGSPGEASNAQPRNIHFLTVGYDAARLEPVAEALMLSGDLSSKA